MALLFRYIKKENPLKYSLVFFKNICIYKINQNSFKPVLYTNQSLLKYTDYNYKLKHSKSKNDKVESDSDSDSDNEDQTQSLKGENVISLVVSSNRCDAILKQAFGIARNKVEEMFYENKILLNQKKIPKKSAQVRPGDSVDIIRGPNPNNPNLTIVSRIEILSIQLRDNNYLIKAHRYKSTFIENEE